METLKDRVIEALENVIDPELGIDIMNLGLVYDVKMSDDNKHAIVDMTLTSMGCPLAPVIIEQVETAMLGVDNSTVTLSASGASVSGGKGKWLTKF